MAHAHLKLLEKYSQQHEHMFVRARRRQSKKKKQQALEDGETDTMLEENDEEMAEAGQRAVRERAFNFTSFESKYLNPKCINTFIALLGFYKELNASQLMRGIKMLHRIFEKRGAEITLYRLDLVDLLNRMMQGPEALPKTHPAFKEVDRFARHYFRKLFSNLEREPTLYVELLFTKINYTTSFLQHGIDQEKHFPKPRAAAQLVVKPGTEHNHFGIGVGALIDDMKSEEVEWLKDVLRKAISQRKQWEDDAQAQRLREVEDQGVPNSTKTAPLILISPETDERKTALFKDGVLRFLMTLIGCEKSDLNGTTHPP